jgi:hypothetical protein
LELKNYFAQDEEGRPLAEALCYVYQRGSETIVSEIQQANGMSLPNPFAADSAGLIQFAAANGLYDVRVVKGNRDYRIHVQCNDVNDTQQAVEAAADRSELARDAAGVAAGLKNSIAEGLQSTVTGQRFIVARTGDESLVVYENRAGAAEEINSYPSTKVLKDQASLISGTSTTGSFLSVVNDEREALAVFGEKSFSTPGFEVSTSGDATSLGDDEFGSLVYGNGKGFRLGNLEFEVSPRPGIRFLNEEREILAEPTSPGLPLADETVLPFSGGLLFHPVIAVPEQGEISIYVKNLLVQRDRSGAVIASIASMTSGATAEGQTLRLDAQRFGSSAALHLRGASDQDTRMSVLLKILKIPVQSQLKPVKVLLIGDSIANRQGAQLLKSSLEKLGFTPTMIGTLRGSASPTDNDDFTGPFGEAREGWETGDYTRAITDRSYPVAVGAEAAYLAMAKDDMRARNPFIRVATAADSSDVVRNGYVFDPAFYQSRFGLETPDIVINALGTNDVRDRTAETIADHVYSNDVLMYRQIRAAWPNARIVRSLPGTAYSSERNALWVTHYTPMIRAMRRAMVDVNDDKIYMAPTWALVSSEAGYPLPISTPNIDGFLQGNFLNLIHPENSGRHGLYEVLANYVAAAALSL